MDSWIGRKDVTSTLVVDVFITHYQQFLGTSRDCEDLDTQGLFINRISDEFSHDMVRHVTNNEVKQAMFSIGDDRAPGPDGFMIIGGINEVVSENQSAFIPGRRISDNILLTQEIVHNYHRNRGPPRCAFKVDIQKAYDTVDWKFLGKRGLRQGDPISPYLFTFVMEVLTLIIKHDLFIFARGELDSARLIMESLDEFQKSSGLVPSELPVKYLGVPLISTRLLNRDCKILVERVLNRIGD
ncbi:ribonuclease H-like domain-containing protein [Tanacetum coccineum]